MRETRTEVASLDPQTAPAARPPAPDVVAGYPGPALLVAVDDRIVEANAAARRLLDADPGWWEEVAAWVPRALAGLAPQASVQVETEHGALAVEWTAVPAGGGACLLLGRDATLERQMRHALAESRQRYKDLVEVSSDFAWETGADGRFVFVSPRGALGYAAEALVGRHPSEFLAEGWDDGPLPFETRRPVNGVELWLRTAGGAPAVVTVSATPVTLPDGTWSGARGVCRDVTEERRRAADLARSRMRERLLGHLVQTLRDEIDPVRALAQAAATIARALEADGCRILVSDAAGALRPVAGLGADPPEALEAHAAGLADSAVPAAVEVEGLHGLAMRTHYRGAGNGALLVWRGSAAGPWSEDERTLFAGVAGQLGIAHAHAAFQERLRRLSETDGLTGLLNRRTFLERLDDRLARTDRPSALLYVDLDNFKAVNDRHGHHRGDDVLRTLGRVLGGAVRSRDLAGRLGGDEFVLWLGGADRARAVAVAERVLEEGREHLLPLSASPERPLGLSVGIAIHVPGDPPSAQALVDRADVAMYEAKEGGKGRWAIARGPDRDAAAGPGRDE